MDYTIYYNQIKSFFEAGLNDYISRLTTSPDVLGRSMSYSLLNGGKRIRPVLFLAVYEALGGKKEDALNFALALEFIHTYSLIHDDLPAMDNDDYRRGKPTNHKVFGEAAAILAGDALLNTAFELCLCEGERGSGSLKAGLYIAKNAGINGMILGQSADLYYTERAHDDETILNYVQSNKTGALLRAAIASPALILFDDRFERLERLGDEIGKLFQITDDVLDVAGSFDKLGKTINKDMEQNKLTAVSVFGLEGAKKRAAESAERCCNIIKQLNFSQDIETFFTDFCNALIDRNG